MRQWKKYQIMAIQIKATEQYFPVFVFLRIFENLKLKSVFQLWASSPDVDDYLWKDQNFQCFQSAEPVLAQRKNSFALQRGLS